MTHDIIKEKLMMLPMEPGCYLMKNDQGTIIYVGKAKRLKQRVSSYFTGAHNYKTTKLVSQIADFDFIITETEKESLILEINLIKEHRPRFNIMFMDDKMYPYLRIPREGKPEVKVARDRKKLANYLYFGPYPDATAARKIAEVLNQSRPDNDGKLFPNTQAIYDQFNKTSVRYSQADYRSWRQQIVSVLNGTSDVFYEGLNRRMMDAAMNMEYELAQRYKNYLEAFTYNNDRQQVQLNRNESFDVFHYAYRQGYIAIVGLFVRAGRLLERSMAVESCLEEPDDALISFIAQYYDSQPAPKTVFVPESIALAELEVVVDATISHAQRGQKRKLMDIALKNANQHLDDQFQLLKDRQQFKDDALKELQIALETKREIHRIEVFDNSHISGSFAVSACVVFDDGEPNKSQYRRYRLHQGNDDVGSMQEVLYRRYFRLLREEGPFPDLILVDGGKQQLNAAKSILADLDFDVAVAALVKDDRHRTHALLKTDGEQVRVDKRSSLFALMTLMQDEVHRFVITYHQHLRKKSMTKSILDEVAGLGPKRIKLLMKTFGSLRGIREATIEELKKYLPADVAHELYAIIHIDWMDSNETHT